MAESRSLKAACAGSSPVARTKRCDNCGEIKSLAEFNRNRTKTDGLQTQCRACSNIESRRYYEADKKAHLARVTKNKRERKIENRSRVVAYLACHPCVDCGEADIVVLEFDHVRGEKTTDVSRMISKGYVWKTIAAEIEKCDVRCANCHRRRTVKARHGSVA